MKESDIVMNRITIIIHILASLVETSSTSHSPNNRRYLTQVLQIGATLAISEVRRIVLNTHLGMGDVYTLNILSVIITLQWLGVEDGRIPNTSMSALTIHDEKHAAKFARLNMLPVFSNVGAWCPLHSYSNEWLLKIDLGTLTTAT